jgi:microcystin degradation protein MlrC
MPLAVAGFVHESDSFLRPLTTLSDFERAGLYGPSRGEAMLAALRGTETEVGGFLRGAEAAGVEAAPVFFAAAPPGGLLADGCFRALLDRLKEAIDAAQPVEGVLLQLHGALGTETNDDADGTVLAEVRSCLPPGVPLVATYDRRANLSPLMVSSCDALLGGAGAERDRGGLGLEAARLLLRMRREEARPVTALAKPPLVADAALLAAAPIRASVWTDGPGAELLALAREAEREPGMLRVGVAAGFPGADAPRMGMGILATADGDETLAADVAAWLAEEAWARREALAAALPSSREYRNVRRPLYPLDSW